MTFTIEASACFSWNVKYFTNTCLPRHSMLAQLFITWYVLLTSSCLDKKNQEWSKQENTSPRQTKCSLYRKKLLFLLEKSLGRQLFSPKLKINLKMKKKNNKSSSTIHYFWNPFLIYYDTLPRCEKKSPWLCMYLYKTNLVCGF